MNEENDIFRANAFELWAGDRNTMTNEEMQQLTVAGLRGGLEIMREALQALYDEQNGPPLLRREAEWNAAMDLARGALALEKQPAGGCIHCGEDHE